MPARPQPGSASRPAYDKSLPLPPPASPAKPVQGPFPASTPSPSRPGASTSRANTPSNSRALLAAVLPTAEDSPVDDKGNKEPLRRRAYFADVVLPSRGRQASSTAPGDDALSEELEFLLSTLGDPLSSAPFPPGQDESSNPRLLTVPSAAAGTPVRMQRADSVDLASSNGNGAAGSSKPDPKKLEPLVQELLTTERTYVKRLTALKKTYADPLRIFSKDPSMAIIPTYNATALFGNIDVLVPVNEAFLADLEVAASPSPPPNASGTPFGIGDVALRHFKELRAFDCYKAFYDAAEDAQAMLADMLARRRGFADFVKASKYKTEGLANVGLKELLMEPVQRIPRYTMMWALMVKYMHPLDPQRAKLLEAMEVARGIAGSEKDEVTRRGMVLMGLGKSIDGFPAELINNNRDYLSSLDVEDQPLSCLHQPSTDPTSPSGPSSSSSSSASGVHETLILFSDRLLLTKRPGSQASGRRLTGLDDLPRLWKGGVGASTSTSKRAGTPSGGGGTESDSGSTLLASHHKDRLATKGMTALTDIVAVDLGSGSFSLHFPNALSHAANSSTHWTRPHRLCTVVHPPKAPGAEPQRAKADKARFVGNLWAAQGLVRANKGKSRVVIGREDEAFGPVAGGKGGVEKGRGYLNVWRREEWVEDATKAKAVLQIDETGTDDYLSWDADGMRRVKLVVKVQPLPGGLSRVGMRTRETTEGEEILPTMSVYSHLLQAIHRFGIYIPRQDPRSAPPTPTHVASPRRPILGLDAISRNLFGSTSSRGGDFSVIGSLSAHNHKRTRSATSKASSTMTTTDYSSSVTRSTISSIANERLHDHRIECDSSVAGSAAHSAQASASVRSPTSSHNRRSPMSRSGSTSPFSTRKPVPIDEEMAGVLASNRSDGGTKAGNEAEGEEDMGDLDRQLELARQNSERASREERRPGAGEVQAIIEPMRVKEAPPSTPASRDTFQRPPTPPLEEAVRRAKSPAIDDVFFSSRVPKSPGLDSRRPHGPRPPTPSSGTALPLRRHAPSPAADLGPSSHQPSPATKPRSRRVSDEWIAARPSLVTAVSAIPSTTPGPFEDASPDSPSSISSGQKRERRNSVDDPSPVLDKKFRTSDGRSPLSPIRNLSTAPQLPPITGLSIRKSPHPSTASQAPRKVSGAGVTKRNFEAEKESTSAHVEDRIVTAIVDARRSAKRIKLEVEGLRSHFSKNIAHKDRLQRVGEMGSLPRSPPSRNISIRAIGRVDEARQAFESVSSSTSTTERPSRKAGVDVAFLTDWCEVLEGLVFELEGDLGRAAVNSDRLSADVFGLIEAKKMTAGDISTLKARLEEARKQLDQARRLAEAQKSELLEAKNENAALYEAFNEELEQMYADMTLPGAEANFAMKRDLQMTKADRNALRLENATLKRELEHAAYEKDRYERILRDRGLL